MVAIEAIGLIKKMALEAVMRMAFMGKYERMNAERAYELGMISEIVDPPEQLRERAQEMGETIAKNSPAAMAATKKALWGALEDAGYETRQAGQINARITCNVYNPLLVTYNCRVLVRKL